MHRITSRRARTLTRATTSVCRALIESLEDRRLMSFSAAVNYPAGTPQDVVRGDFNGDTQLDLAVTNYSANTVSVLLGNANGTFQAALTSTTGAGPQSVAVGAASLVLQEALANPRLFPAPLRAVKSRR